MPTLDQQSNTTSRLEETCTKTTMADKGDAATNSTNTEASNIKENSAKAVIKSVDMSEEMQRDCVEIAAGALEQFNIEKDIAAQIKKECDKRFGPTWHVVVGKNFGSYVTHGKLNFFTCDFQIYT